MVKVFSLIRNQFGLYQWVGEENEFLDYSAEAALAVGGGGEAGEAFEELSEVGLGLEAEFVAYFLDGEVSVGKSGHSGQQRILVDEVLA